MRTKGFTLIEVMIATGLFVVLMIFGVAAILNSNVLFKKNQTQRAVLDNIAFVVEDMSRLLRTGGTYQCNPSLPLVSAGTNDCFPTPGGFPYKSIAFEPFNGDPNLSTDQVVYAFLPDGLYKSEDSGSSIISGTPQFKMTPDSITFSDESGFIVRGSGSSSDGDQQQPIVFVKLVGFIEDEQNDFQTPFNYQFAITQRRTDF